MTTLYEVRAEIHRALDEHSIAEVLNEVALAINEHADLHVRTPDADRGANRRAARLDALSIAVGRLSNRAEGRELA